MPYLTNLRKYAQTVDLRMDLIMAEPALGQEITALGMKEEWIGKTELEQYSSLPATIKRSKKMAKKIWAECDTDKLVSSKI